MLRGLGSPREYERCAKSSVERLGSSFLRIIVYALFRPGLRAARHLAPHDLGTHDTDINLREAVICTPRATKLGECCCGLGFPSHEQGYQDQPIQMSGRERPTIDVVAVQKPGAKDLRQ